VLITPSPTPTPSLLSAQSGGGLTQLAAGSGSGGVQYDLDIDLMAAGFTADEALFFPAEVLERDGPSVFNSALMFMNHPSFMEEFSRPERSRADRLGFVVEGSVKWDPSKGAQGKLVGQAVLTNLQFKDEIRLLSKHGMLGREQLSTRVMCLSEEREFPDGRPYSYVTALVPHILTSVDFVTVGRADGMVTAIHNSLKPNSAKGDSTPMDLKQLLEAFTALSAKVDAIATPAAPVAGAQPAAPNPEILALSASIQTIGNGLKELADRETARLAEEEKTRVQNSLTALCDAESKVKDNPAARAMVMNRFSSAVKEADLAGAKEFVAELAALVPDPQPQGPVAGPVANSFGAAVAPLTGFPSVVTPAPAAGSSVPPGPVQNSVLLDSRARMLANATGISLAAARERVAAGV